MFKAETLNRDRFENQIEIGKMLLKSGNGVVGLAIILAFVVIAVFAPNIAPYPPNLQDVSNLFQAPSAAHIMGTDRYGRDVFSRVIFATRLDLLLAVTSITISYVIGVSIGILSGYFGKITDNIIMRIMDILLSFPSILFAIAIAISIGPGFTTVVIAVAVIAIPSFARVARSTVLSTKEELFVMGAVSIGSSRGHVMLHHILPSAIAPTVVLYSLNLGYAILISAGLTFLGVGIPPPTAEWGGMITNGLNQVISGEWWLTTFPGIFLTLAIMGFNMLGDAMREVMDVTLRR